MKTFSKVLLNSVCSIALLGSHLHAANSFIEENEPSQIQHSSRSYFPLAGVSKFLNYTKNYPFSIVDKKVEQEIHSIAIKSGESAAAQIHNRFFLDYERYGIVEATGQRVAIYKNHSKILNSIFKEVTGKSIDEIVDVLPFGFTHVAKGLRNKLEGLVVKSVFENLAHIGIENIVEKSLLSGYGYGKDKISRLINFPSVHKNTENAVSEFLKAFPKETNSSFQERDALDHIISKPLQNGITLQHIFDGYEIRLKEFANDQLKNIINDAITYGVKEIGSKGIHTAFSKTKQAAYTVAAFGGMAGSPAFGVAAGGFGLLVNEVEKDITEYLLKGLGTYTQNFGQTKFQQIIPIDYSKDGITISRTLEDSLILGNEGWEEINYTAPSFKNLFIEFIQPTAKALEKALNPSYEPSNVKESIVWEKGIRYDLEKFSSKNYNPKVDIIDGYTRPENPYIIHFTEDPKSPFYHISEKEIDLLSSKQLKEYEDQAANYVEEVEKDRKRHIEVAQKAAAAGKLNQNIQINNEAPIGKLKFTVQKNWFGTITSWFKR